MATPYLGEIRAFGFNFPPRGWAQCNGQVLPINQNQALYSLLGTTYGGDGRSTFALPDMRGRTFLKFGQGAGLPNYGLGAKGGQEDVTLTVANLPAHTHAVQASSNAADQSEPSNARVLGKTEEDIYGSEAASEALHPTTVGNAGGNQAHPNMQPFLAINYCIALQGVFPSRN